MTATDTGTSWVLPDQVFDGETLFENLAIAYSDGRVSKIVAAQNIPDGANAKGLAGIVSPGFVDLQVNGGNSVLFNQEPTSDGIAKIAAAHRGFGTVKLLPTLITDAPKVLENAVDAVLDSISDSAILGIHIEGPHISTARKGTHAARFVRPLDDATFSQIRRLREKNIPVMITVAPEAATNTDITKFCELGVVVSIGHSDATAKVTNAALDAGAICFTHLFNAMSPMQGREPGVVGAAINSGAHIGIICDGIHVADEMVALAIRARPVQKRMFLVSDAMPTVGGSKEFNLYGETVSLKGGCLVNQNGNLAGAHTTMFQSIGRLVNRVGIALEEALRMATSVPLNLMHAGNSTSPMLIGMDLEDVVVFDTDLSSIRHLTTALKAD